jgi:hypothetical protein
MASTTLVERSNSEVSSILSNASSLREEAIRAKDMVEIGYMKLAKCLYDIYTQNVYQVWDFPNFENYIDSELQFNYRKAMYLVEIYNKALMLNMDMDRLERLGWTKAKELIRVVDQSNAEEWIEIAENSTAKELNFKVKTEKDSQRDKSSVIDDTPTITTITLKLGMVEHAIIKDALEESARLINTEDIALAFANICQEWSESKGIVPILTTLEDHIEHLERIYGRRLSIQGTISTHEEEEEEDDEVSVTKNKEDSDEFEELF